MRADGPSGEHFAVPQLDAEIGVDHLGDMAHQAARGPQIFVVVVRVARRLPHMRGDDSVGLGDAAIGVRPFDRTPAGQPLSARGTRRRWCAAPPA